MHASSLLRKSTILHEMGMFLSSELEAIPKKRKIFYENFFISGVAVINLCAWEAIPQSIRIITGCFWVSVSLAIILREYL